MKHFWKRATALLLSAVMCAGLCVTGFAMNSSADDSDEITDGDIQTYASADTETITADFQYHQDIARESLQYVNEFRASDTWYWNSDNSTKTYVGKLDALTYDYGLEEVAMQRAAEISVYYSHSRPDGSNRSYASQEYGYSGTTGECILYIGGVSSASNPKYIIEIFEENDEDYSGQGHRRIMLDSSGYGYVNYAMGCVQVGNYYYWCMIVSKPSAGANTSNPTEAVNGTKSVTMPVSADYVNVGSTISIMPSYNVRLGTTESDPLPSVSATIKSSGSGTSIDCTVNPAYVSNDESVVTIDNENRLMYYVGAGSTTVSGDVLGYTRSYSVTVTENLDANRPVITHIEAKDATCTDPGNIEYWMTETTVYYDSYEEIKYYKDEALTEEISYEDTIIPALGHEWDDGTVITDPKCTTAGEMLYTCERCGETRIDEIPATGHKFSGDKDDLTWNWSSDYKSAEASYVCTVCGETVTVTANVTVSDSDCTCTDPGYITYTATVEIDGEFYYDYQREQVPALGHELSCEFIWNNDNGDVTCQAHITCVRGDIDVYEACTVTMTDSTEATCTSDGTETYVAAIGYDGKTFESDPYTIVTEKAYGHDYSVTNWDWSADHSTCKATFTCANCGDEYTVNCEVTVNYTAPECEKQGVYEYTAKAEGFSNTEFVYIDALGHEWNSGVVTTEPTCVSEGVMTYTCERCGATRTEAIPATGEHTWNSGVITKEATCTEDGIMTYTCLVCGATYDVTIPATGGHTWDGGVVTKEPTCTEDGVMTYTCTKCGATETVTLDALGHNYTSNTVAPTCTEDGYTEHTCTRCGFSYTDDFVSALGHDYQTQFNWASDYSSCTITITCSRGDYNETFDCTVTSSITKQPGCETLGETTYTASYNGLTSVIVIADIPATDHVYRADAYVWYDEEGHIWSYGGQQDEDFIWNENVTCKANLTCTVCGKTFTADCIVTVSDEYGENGLPVTVYTAKVGDTGLYFTVTRDDSTGNVIGIETTDATAEGSAVGDSSAEMANENHLGDVVSEYETGELVMPDATVTGSDTDGGRIQTGDVIAFIGTAMLASAGVLFAVTRKHENKEEG